MKIIYISLPITGHEDTYEQRLDEAVEYVKEKHPEYERIITPKYVADELNELQEISQHLSDVDPMKMVLNTIIDAYK